MSIQTLPEPYLQIVFVKKKKKKFYLYSHRYAVEIFYVLLFPLAQIK